MSNLRMLSHKTFEVKDLPFDQEGFVEKYSVLMPVDYSKKVAEFNFTAQFTRSVPTDMVSRPLEGAPEGTPVLSGYVLTARAIFEKEFTLNHHKDLDKAQIQCIFRNITSAANKQVSGYSNVSLCQQSTRIYFNKTVLPLG